MTRFTQEGEEKSANAANEKKDARKKLHGKSDAFTFSNLGLMASVHEALESQAGGFNDIKVGSFVNVTMGSFKNQRLKVTKRINAVTWQVDVPNHGHPVVHYHQLEQGSAKSDKAKGNTATKSNDDPVTTKVTRAGT